MARQRDVRAPAKQGPLDAPARQRARSALPAFALWLAVLAAACAGDGRGPTAGPAPTATPAGSRPEPAASLYHDPVHGFRVPYPADWRTVP
ncbi:MAG TPA: hypothetical protein VIO14_10230, partial [Dehalococcoidia bacterium]